MSSFLLHQDILNYVLVPMFVSDEQRRIIVELATSPRQPQPLHALISIPNVLRHLLEIRCVSVALRNAVASSVRTDELVAASQNWRTLHMMMQGAKRQHMVRIRYVLEDIQQRRIPPMYVSDGCIGCGAALPCWWPILHYEMWGPRSAAIRKERRLNVSRKRLNSVLKSAGQPIAVGCCGQECYKKMYGAAIPAGEGEGTGVFIHWCKHCSRLIHPAEMFEARKSWNAVAPYYCSEICEDEDTEYAEFVNYLAAEAAAVDAEDAEFINYLADDY